MISYDNSRRLVMHILDHVQCAITGKQHRHMSNSVMNCKFGNNEG